MIRFAQPELLWLLLLLPLIALWRGRKGAIAAVEYSSAETARQVARETRSRVGRWLPALRLLAAALAILALSRPQLGRGSTEVEASGADLVLAVDVSGSMQALHKGRRARQSLGSGQIGRLEIHRRAPR